MNKLFHCFALCIFLASDLFALSVDFKDEQLYNPSILALRTRIFNESETPVQNVKFRYIFTKRADAQIVLDSGYTAGAQVSLQMVNDTLGYVEILISSVPQGFFPNSSGFYQGLHYSDWSVLGKHNHPSYWDELDFVENSNILLYVKDSLVSGNFSLLPALKPKLKIVGFQPEGNAWIDIKNLDKEGTSLHGIKLMDRDGVEFALDSIYMDAMETLRICKNDSACGTFEKKYIMPNFAWGRIGEALLKDDSTLYSYVPWGDVGEHVNEAVLQGVWKDVEDFFEAPFMESYYSVEFLKNHFYRIRGNEKGMKTGDWFSYTDRDDSSVEHFAPEPIKLTMNKPENYRLTSNDSVLFEWLPVKHVSRYKLIVRNADNQIVDEVETSETAVKMYLPDGNYSWLVYCDEFVDGDGFVYRKKEDDSLILDLENTSLVSANVNMYVWNALPIDTIKARKDTRLLNLGYGQDAMKYGWDRPHYEQHSAETKEYNHCWLVAAQVINHLYKGNVAQDEIEFAVRFNEKEPLMSPFSVAGADSGDAKKALKFALRTDSLVKIQGSPSYGVVKQEIDNNRPIYVSILKHAMVIFGYVGTSDNYAFLYAFEGDNDGRITNSLTNPSPIKYYVLTNNITGPVTMSNPKVYRDSDSDGIMDFDEEERFKTNPFDYDTDGDGIDDKREIYGYMRMSKYDPKNYTDISRETTIASKITKNSDADNDGIRKESDPDDDNNGINDGLEGNVKFQIDDMNVPLDYTLFARDHLVINDGVECYNAEIQKHEYCRIASGGKNIFSYGASTTALSLGVRSHVGNVDARIDKKSDGRILIRNFAHIHGNLNLYVKTVSENVLNSDGIDSFGTCVDMQNGSLIDGIISEKLAYCAEGDTNSWNNDFQCNLPSIDRAYFGEKKIVRNKEIFVLNDGAAFRSLKVEPGGKLVIAAGEFYIDSLLQLEPNAKIEFLNPGKASVLHLNGDIIWRLTSDYSLTDAVYWSNVARGFKLVQHSSKKMFIEGPFGGTIYAPLSKLVLGQDTKMIYGRFLAKDITVHQYSKVFRVDYNPVVDPSYAIRRR